MNWVQALLDDENVFPSKIGGLAPSLHRPLAEDVITGVPFPRNFKDTVKTICRRLFRVYAHLYSNHFEQICALGIEGVSFLRAPVCALPADDRTCRSTSQYKLSSFLPVYQRGDCDCNGVSREITDGITISST